MSDTPTVPDEMLVVPWRDSIVDGIGFGPASPYPEQVWLPRLGPTGYLMWRELCRHLHRNPVGAPMAVDDLAAALGVGSRGGTSPIRRTITRLTHFDVVRLRDEELAVRRRLPRLTDGQAAALPERARAAHARLARRPVGAR